MTSMGLAGLSAILGIVAVRWGLVVPAFAVPQLPGLDRAYIDQRLVYQYAPSGLEWLTSVGLIALVVLIFSAAYLWLPIYEGEVRSKHAG